MTPMRLVFTIDADGKSARVEIDKTARSVREAAGAATDMGEAGERAAADTRRLAAAADAAEGQVQGMAAAERAAAQTALGVQRSHKLAAGSVGNLTAQFNDIGVMLAAGQNPLQLALQQGTQITQVLGPMGAGQAVRSLGAAFMSLLSPINLITIGSIAAGATIFNWLTDAGEEARTFEDDLSSLTDSIDTYIDVAARSNQTTAESAAQYGAAAAEVRELMHAEEERAARTIRRESANAIHSLVAETPLVTEDPELGDQQDAAKLFGLRIFPGIGRNRLSHSEVSKNRGMVNEILNGYQRLDAAAESSVGTRIALTEDLLSSLRQAATAVDGISAAEDALIGPVLELLRKLRDEQAALGNASAEGIAAPYLEYYQSRIAGERFLRNARDQEMSEQAAIYGIVAETRAESEASVGAAEARLAALSDEVSIQQAIAAHGADSAAVARARADAERAAFEETLATLDVADSLKDTLRAAFEQALAVANVDLAGGIGAGADAAGRLADNLLAAAHFAQQAAAMQAANPPDPGGQGGLSFGGGAAGDPSFGDAALGFGNVSTNPRRTVVDLSPPAFSSRGGGGGGGGVGGGVGAQSDALSRFIERQETELELLRTVDPVQKELIRNREALAGATDAERDAVTQLIAERITERERLDDLKDAHDDLTRSIDESLRRVVFEGGSLEDLFTGLADAIAEAAWEAAALGKGLGAGPLGTKQSGGFIGMLADGLLGLIGVEIPAKAEGGMIHGPGGPTDDRVLMWGSNGEFVVNADATAKYRHQLEAINAGNLPAFASGGIIGGGASGGGIAPAPVIELVNASGTPPQASSHKLNGASFVPSPKRGLSSAWCRARTRCARSCLLSSRSRPCLWASSGPQR